MNKTGFFPEHHEAKEITHRDVWVLSRIAVASAAALTMVTFGLLIG
jgi:hypothetical protein